MDEKKREEISLFRYGLIAPVIHENVLSQMKYFREISAKEYEVPHTGKRRYRVSALKSWLRSYRMGGIDALKPKERVDKNKSRKITPMIGEAIREIVGQYPFLSTAAVFRLLISEGIIGTADLGEATVRKYIEDNGLRIVESEQKPRKKYEKEHINQLWISDFMHGPHIGAAGKKKKVYLCAIIDDHSRVIVGGRFFLSENTTSLGSLLKDAIGRFGLPLVFYCDNGSVYSSASLQLGCARLGISLVHSRPYDSPSRGKIERFNRTVREKFLVMLKLQEITDIEEMNSMFNKWLEGEYNRGYHHGIGTRPMDRYMEDIRQTNIKRVSREELDMAFLRTIKRRVKNDSTISFEAKIYEVPPKYIGKVIECRYPMDKPEKLTLYEESKPVLKLHKVDVHENAKLPTLGIKFKKEEEQ